MPAYLILYGAAWWAIFAYGFGIDLVGWRAGYQPFLTFSKRLPNHTQTSAMIKPVKYLEDYWSGFRGARRDGVYEEQSILTNWPAVGLRQIWRHPVGGGYSSFVVAEGRLYTLEQRRENEVATAYDIETGRELWRNGWDADFDEAYGGDGPRATPTYDAGHIYALGATGELRCLEAATGKLVWRRNIIDETHARLTVYGVAASPLIVNDKVIVLPGGLNGQSIAAYDKRTGAPLWKQGKDPEAYTSPMLVTLAGQRQILIVSARNVMGLVPEDGRELWHAPWVVPNDNAIGQPVLFGTNRFLVSGGYGLGCRTFEIGRTNWGFTVREIWRSPYLKNKFSSSIFYRGCVFGLDEDILACLDATTGVRKWKAGRYGYGQLLLAGDHLVVMAENGILALVDAAPEGFVERFRFQALNGKTWNTPAIANGKIFVRNASEMACYDISAPAKPFLSP